MSVLSVSQLNVFAEFFRGIGRPVRDLSFALERGERLAVVGESGSGKTMTALALFGLLPSNCRAEGRAELNGRNLLTMKERALNALRGRELVYVPQSGAEYLNPSAKISEHMDETLRAAGVRDRAARKSLAAEKLAAAGLEDVARVLKSYPFELSGGMAQKTVLALAACASPSLVVADEPTKGIDEASAEKFLDGLDTLFPDAAVMLITHNIAVAERCASVLVMFGGCAVEYGSAEKVLATPSHPYTSALLAALPENGFCAPRPAMHPQGENSCPYFSRCPRSDNRCFDECPPLKDINGVLTRCFYA